MTVGDTLAGAGGMPIPPKQPILLSSLLREYSCSLFDAEASNYETTPELSDSLRLLAVKIEGRLLRTALHGKDGILRVFIGDLTYHLDEETMTSVVREALKAQIDAHLRRREYQVDGPLPSPPQGLIEAPKQAGMVSVPEAQQHVKARDVAKDRRTFVEAILLEKGWSILDWANEATVAYHTAADYLLGKRTPYRSTLLKLAKALGVPPNQLPE
jgi:lambda repressor-like predicted transcriptional regulator